MAEDLKPCIYRDGETILLRHSKGTDELTLEDAFWLLSSLFHVLRGILFKALYEGPREN